MKSLKLILVLMMAAVASLTSCEKNTDLSPLADDTAMVDLLFFATTGDSTSADSTYGFGHRHHKCSITEVDSYSLPEAVLSYISTNYAEATIKRAGVSGSTGYYMVILELNDGTHTGLIFDAEGNFVTARTHPGRGTELAPANLPEAITAYLAANYAGAAVEHARLHPDGSYGVVIALADGTYLGLGFDATGEFTSSFDLKNKAGQKHGKGPKGKGGKRGH